MSAKRSETPSDVTAPPLCVHDISPQLAVLFTDAFQLPEFEAPYDASKLDMPKFLSWLMDAGLDVVADIRAIESKQFFRRAPGANFTSVFGVVDDGPLREVSTP